MKSKNKLKSNLLKVLPVAALFLNSIDTYSVENSMDLNASKFIKEWKYYSSFDKLDRDGKSNGEKISIECYALEGISYVSKPIDKKVEVLNIYVPKEYMKKNYDGTYSIDNNAKFVTKDTNGKTISYTAQTAPIVYYNTVNGYSQGNALTMGATRMGGGDYTEFVKQGLIVVGIGALGKESKDSKGNYIGKAPMGLVDLKSGVKYLKYNDKFLPGDSNKIISVGASAGGAMSSLLGATGNSKDYDRYFKELGAAPSKDDVYAAITYCPITNLDNADSAYEWMYQGIYKYQSFGSNFGIAGPEKTLTDFQKIISQELNKDFIKYVEKLGLDLSTKGNSGEYYEELTRAYEKSIMDNIIMNCTTNSKVDENKVNEFIKKLDPNETGWVKWNSATKTVKITGFLDFVKNHLTRKKGCTSFDELDLGLNENTVFGNTTTNSLHFSNNVMNILKKLSPEYKEAEIYYKEYSDDIDKEMLERTYLMNPMNYIEAKEKSDIAPYWRINIGSEDSDVGVVTGFTMGKVLEKNKSAIVDFNIIWGYGHGPAEYSVNDLINYVKDISNN